MTPGDGGLTGHVLDLDAIHHLLDAKSNYGREIVRQSVLRNTTLLLPAVAAQCVAGFRPHQAEALFSVPVVTIGGLPVADVLSAAQLGPKMWANLEQHAPGRLAGAEVGAVLAAAHAVILAEARGGWRIITSAPHLYYGIPDVRLEILP
ncbi:hypothetical protein OG884_10390 [Streptosporangium sp. NBC_01755]|uniref:hypothetical protein n=1 Tax=unclassified Streptosporangium TaxID=2632669 RepID=UPI002DDA116D|nr:MULTISPECIES: hypothetical protein [unclassified Streptosporangium]WSA26285.1 hypothetical protein OIE13_36295 [Streptosporangium sp. NBC_01810]WSD02287.1 hypothetical protein OG884_10390 [Streptosporangium sp. NBC_01755]